MCGSQTEDDTSISREGVIPPTKGRGGGEAFSQGLDLTAAWISSGWACCGTMFTMTELTSEKGVGC